MKAPASLALALALAACAGLLQGCAQPLVDARGHGQAVRRATDAQRLPRQAPPGDGRAAARELEPALAAHRRGEALPPPAGAARAAAPGGAP